MREAIKAAAVRGKSQVVKIFKATYLDTSRGGCVACTKSSQSGCDVGLTHQDYTLTCSYGSKLNAPKQEPLATWFITRYKSATAVFWISYPLPSVSVCRCWCVLGRQGICIISPNDKHPLTTLV